MGPRRRLACYASIRIYYLYTSKQNVCASIICRPFMTRHVSRPAYVLFRQGHKAVIHYLGPEFVDQYVAPILTYLRDVQLQNARRLLDQAVVLLKKPATFVKRFGFDKFVKLVESNTDVGAHVSRTSSTGRSATAVLHQELDLLLLLIFAAAFISVYAWRHRRRRRRALQLDSRGPPAPAPDGEENDGGRRGDGLAEEDNAADVAGLGVRRRFRRRVLHQP